MGEIILCYLAVVSDIDQHFDVASAKHSKCKDYEHPQYIRRKTQSSQHSRVRLCHVLIYDDNRSRWRQLQAIREGFFLASVSLRKAEDNRFMLHCIAFTTLNTTVHFLAFHCIKQYYSELHYDIYVLFVWRHAWPYWQLLYFQRKA